MDLKQLVLEARTCRRFSQEEMPMEVLTDLVDTARLTPSARNAQIIRYAVIHEKNLRTKMEEAFVLGGSLPADQKPQRGIDSPTAYIVLLAPQEITHFGTMDLGIAAQTMQLRAAEQGYAACMVGSFKKEVVADILQKEGVSFFDEESGAKLIPHLLLVLGKPSQAREVTSVKEDGKLSYYHDERGVNMVPKRSLDAVLLLKK